MDKVMVLGNWWWRRDSEGKCSWNALLLTRIPLTPYSLLYFEAYVYAKACIVSSGTGSSRLNGSFCFFLFVVQVYEESTHPHSSLSHEICFQVKYPLAYNILTMDIAGRPWKHRQWRARRFYVFRCAPVSLATLLLVAEWRLVFKIYSKRRRYSSGIIKRCMWC